MMHIDPADQYQRGTSRIHALDPRIKLLAALGLIVAVALLPTRLATNTLASLLLLWLATLGIAARARLGWAFALKRSFIALPFALAAVTLPFTIPGTPLAQWGALTLSVEGTARFLGIVLKSWVSVQAALLLTATTAFPEVLWALRALRVPRTLISIISFMYRYLFVLGDEALRLMRARAARSAGTHGGTWLWRGQVAGGMVGNLALRAFERSERIYDAMVARGFQGDLRTLTPPLLTRADLNALALWVAYLAMNLLIAWMF